MIARTVDHHLERGLAFRRAGIELAGDAIWPSDQLDDLE
jgi:hypothetical protein